MKCSNPFVQTFYRDGVRRCVRVRCRQCLACRITNREQWSSRIGAELASRSGKGAFVTLTYSDDTLPLNSDGVPNLVVSDFQKFMKRLRITLQRKYKITEPIKYYSVGEYGELSSKIGNGRPHFHFILTGISFWDSRLRKAIQECWTFGFNKILSANRSTIRYVLKYMDKSMSERKAIADKGLTPPFSLKSLGIGREYIIKHASEIVRDKGFRYKKSSISLPPYWAKLINLQYPDMSTSINCFPPSDLSPSLFKKYIKSKYYPDVGNFLLALGKQQEYNLNAAYNVGKER